MKSQPLRSPDYIASIDPGKHACGLAIWRLIPDVRLVKAEWVRNPFKDEPGVERAERWGDMARQVAGVISRWQQIGWKVSLLLEIPQVYSGESEKDKNDLLDLAGVQGAIVGATNCDVEWSPLPKEWKGQLPKEVSEKRVDSKLLDSEKALIQWPAKSYRHNVYDAIHLGIVYLEREGLRDFTK